MSINRSLNLLYPPFREKLTLGLSQALREGIYAHIFEGYRSTERQAFLFAQGRVAPGPIVTWAKPGLSIHQYGLAVDIAFDAKPDTPKVDWTWAPGSQYDRVAAILRLLGIEWLGDKKIEKAHFQMTLGFSIQEIKQITDSLGVLGLWAELDKRLEEKGHV